jgi:hypothetical protein
MSDFDGLVRDDKNPDPLPSEQTTFKKSSSKKGGIAGALGADDIGSLARKFDLDPELGEKVLVPLINFLDKYGVGDAVNESPTVSSILSLAEFWNDISPVVKNATQYFGGKQKDLSEDDVAFLDRIREAQSETADMTLFQDSSSIGEVVEPEKPPEPVKVVKDPFKTAGAVDWFEMLGEPKGGKKAHYETSSTLTSLMPDTNFGVSGLDQLAKEAGLSIEELRAADSQSKFNNANSNSGLDYTDPNFGAKLNLGVDKITASMKSEKDKYERTSAAQFIDMPVPESAQTYDPLTVTGLEMPALKGGGLESIQSMAIKAGVTEEELHNSTALGGKDPKTASAQDPELAYSEVVHPTSPGELPQETYIVDFGDYSTDE